MTVDNYIQILHKYVSDSNVVEIHQDDFNILWFQMKQEDRVQEWTPENSGPVLRTKVLGYLNELTVKVHRDFPRRFGHVLL